MRSLIWLSLSCTLLIACSDPPSRHLKLTSQSSYSSSISPNGQYAVIGSIHHGGSLWRIKDSERLYNWNHDQGQKTAISTTTISTDSLFALTADKKRLVMWDIKTGKYKGFWSTTGNVLSLALSDNGAYALVGQDDYTALYIETRTGSILQKLHHTDDINTVAISADGQFGVTGSEDGNVKIWKLDSDKPLHTYKLGDDIAAVAMSRNGTRVFGGLYYGKGKIWNARTGNEISTVGFSRSTISAARFVNKGKKLITGDTVRRVMVWDVNSGKKIRQKVAKAPSLYPPSGLVVEEVALQSNGTITAIYSDGSVNIWNKKG